MIRGEAEGQHEIKTQQKLSDASHIPTSRFQRKCDGYESFYRCRSEDRAASQITRTEEKHGNFTRYIVLHRDNRDVQLLYPMFIR